MVESAATQNATYRRPLPVFQCIVPEKISWKYIIHVNMIRVLMLRCPALHSNHENKGLPLLDLRRIFHAASSL